MNVYIDKHLFDALMKNGQSAMFFKCALGKIWGSQATMENVVFWDVVMCFLQKPHSNISQKTPFFML
jgi:hypothetical protein